MSFKNFDCKDLFTGECCPDRETERFCLMRNDPRSSNWEVLRVEVHSCCKHIHEAKQLPIEFYIEHHKPYVIKEVAKSTSMKKKMKEEDDDWLW